MMPKLDGIGVVRELKADPSSARDPGHPRHRQVRHPRRGRGARRRRRRLPDQAVRAFRPARSGALDAAPEGAARHSPGAGAQAGRVEPVPRRERRRAGSEDRADRTGCGASCRSRSPISSSRRAMTTIRSSSHRREVTVVFCDLRGFTAFAEIAEPEEVMAVLGEYHACLGSTDRAIMRARWSASSATVCWWSSTTRCPAPTTPSGPCAWRSPCATRSANCRSAGGARATRSASASASPAAMPRSARSAFDRRSDYAVIGTVPNLAARLCDRGQGRARFWSSQRAFLPIEPFSRGASARRAVAQRLPPARWRPSKSPAGSAEARAAGMDRSPRV